MSPEPEITPDPQSQAAKLRAAAFKGSTKSENTQAFVDAANEQINVLMELYSEKGKGAPEWDTFFNALAVQLSKQNIKDGNGGPFGALIVEYEGGLDENGKGIGKPIVKGVGANHVFPKSDPSAHAEMEAYRDFAKRTGKSDMKGMTLYTSCECCPMCLGIANAAGVRRISYVNTREMAGDIKFSDKLQYDLLSQEDLLKQMTHAESLIPREKDALQKKLGTRGAMVLDADGNVFSYGDDDTEVDPTRVASIQAVREACRLASSFDLPDGYSLVTQKIPHMSGLITADWARILRDRNPNHMDDPSYDSKSISSGKIIYIKPEYEQVVLRNGQGETRIAQKTEETYKQPGLRDQQRKVQTEKYTDTGLASRSRLSLDKSRWETVATGKDGITRPAGEKTLNPKDMDDTTIAAGAAARVFETWMYGITNGFQRMY